MSLTTTGANRERYAQLMRATDPRPSRFIDPHVYRAWLARADMWAEHMEASA